MKNLFLLLKSTFLVLVPLLLKTTFVVGAGGAVSVQLPALSGLFSVPFLSLLGTGLYWLEILVRAVPSLAASTPLTWFLSFLEKLVPNRAFLEDGGSGVHVLQSVVKPTNPPACGFAVA